MEEGRPRQGSEIRRWLSGCGNSVETASDSLILGGPSWPILAYLQFGRGVGGDAAMNLMKRPLPERDHRLDTRQSDCAFIEVKIDEAATGGIETLVHSMQFAPHFSL